MELSDVKVDLHTHIISDLKKRSIREFVWENIFGNKRVKSINELVDLCSLQNQNTLLGITEFGGENHVYDFILESKKDLENNFESDFKNQNVYFGVKNKKGFWNYFIRTEEIQTDKTRVLVVGGTKQIGKRSLKEVLDESDRKNCLKVALMLDYPVLKNIRLSKEEFDDYAIRFDAIDLNLAHPGMHRDIKKISREYGIPIIYSSEAGNKNKLFYAYNTFNRINFSNSAFLKESLEESLIHKRYTSVIENKKNYKGYLQNLSSFLYQKTGLLK